MLSQLLLTPIETPLRVNRVSSHKPQYHFQSTYSLFPLSSKPPKLLCNQINFINNCEGVVTDIIQVRSSGFRCVEVVFPSTLALRRIFPAISRVLRHKRNQESICYVTQLAVLECWSVLAVHDVLQNVYKAPYLETIFLDVYRHIGNKMKLMCLLLNMG